MQWTELVIDWELGLNGIESWEFGKSSFSLKGSESVLKKKKKEQEGCNERGL